MAQSAASAHSAFIMLIRLREDTTASTQHTSGATLPPSKTSTWSHYSTLLRT
jgi:hypothetical protein